MPSVRRLLAGVAALGAALALVAPESAEAGRNRHEAAGQQTYASPQSDPLALSADGSTLYVASTTSNRVHVVDTASGSVVDAIRVGMEPVSLALRPGADELWVTNHVSDSVSVIDTNPASASHRLVVETVQAMTSESLVTRFDEPVGIAFTEDGSKAYVALSSRNDVAVVDAAAYQVTDFLHVDAQDPRALAVRNGKLFVAAFESSNRTEVSACTSGGSPPQCTLGTNDLVSFAINNPNIPGATKNIVVDPDLPDRDVFVFDASDDSLIDVVSGVGTLLYGLTVTDSGELFVAQTDARNAENGLQGEGLADLENRMFLNQITRVPCGGSSCGSPTRIDLEPLPPTDPAAGEALATPYGITASADGTTLVATAAASSRVFTMDRASGSVLDRLDVGAIPRGVVLRSDAEGAPQTAYVLNTLGNSVSVVDVADPANLSELDTIGVGMDDPTPEAVRFGRIAFNDAGASSSGTFACASCHPDGHTDQLMWRIGGACFFGDCSEEDEPRSTMPVRGLRDTLPLHWDGTLGDPFGGANGAVGNGGSEPADCSATSPHGCFRDLVDATLGGPMCEAGSCPTGPSGQPGRLGVQEREDMATFLESVSYPPARSRRLDDRLSEPSDDVTIQTASGAQTVSARAGFEDFFRNQGSALGVGNPNTCADSDAGCHELPLGTATNSETLGGFDAPTMRGMTDRFLQFSLGITATEELLAASDSGLTVFGFNLPPNPVKWNGGAKGYEELVTFGVAFNLFTPVYNVGALDIFQMTEEASTGHSGALGRQVTLNTATTNGSQTAATQALLDALEDADERGVVNLRGRAVVDGSKETISYEGSEGFYKVGSEDRTPSELVQQAQSGAILATLTAYLPSVVHEVSPQPLLATPGSACGTVTTGFPTTSDDPRLPRLSAGSLTMALEGEHVRPNHRILVDGEPVSGTIQIASGTSVCNTDGDPQDSLTTQPLEITLGSLPASTGLHVLQVQARRGLLSNELPFVVE